METRIFSLLVAIKRKAVLRTALEELRLQNHKKTLNDQHMRQRLFLSKTRRFFYKQFENLLVKSRWTANFT